MNEVMSRWALVLMLTMVSFTASAQPQQRAQRAVATDTAEAVTRAAAQHVGQLAIHRAALAKRYQDELDAIDRLKTQRASWRRDRELRDRMSSSLETANLLSATTRELDRAEADLVTTRRSYLSAIDAELAAGAVPVRLLQLSRARAVVAPELKDAPRRIVIPDLEIDPLADPEELDQRAAELRASEDKLSRQVAELRTQAAELDRLAVLRKQHERAGDLFNRDDDQPHRNPARRAGDSGGSEEGGSSGPLPSAPGSTPTSTFENYVPIVLADVIDATTISSLAAAQRSGDPAQRAAAAHKTHDAVAARLDEVRRKRAEIEARARQLRAKR